MIEYLESARECIREHQWKKALGWMGWAHYIRIFVSDDKGTPETRALVTSLKKDMEEFTTLKNLRSCDPTPDSECRVCPRETMKT